MTSEYGPDADGVIALPAEITQRQAVGLLKAYADARRKESAAREEKESIGEQIKRYLARHPEEALHDGEHEIDAAAAPRRLPDSYTTKGMPISMLLALRDAGALTVDAKLVVKLMERSVVPFDVRKYLVPGGSTVALVVTEGRKK